MSDALDALTSDVPNPSDDTDDKDETLGLS